MCFRSPACRPRPGPTPTARDASAANADKEDCLALAALLKGPGAPLSPDIETAHAPWGVQVAGGFSGARAIDAYTALQRTLRLSSSATVRR